MMLKFALFVVFAYLLVVQIDSESNALNARKARVRFLNSMPQFGKSKLFAETPQQTVFDAVPPGYMTSYSDVDAKPWSFTARFSTNVTAKSDLTDLDSDSFATVFTCQTNQRKLKNKLIYDSQRSGDSRSALIRTVNLAQFDYPIDVINRTNQQQLFNSINYCQASRYQTIPPGEYTLDWTVSDSKKRGIQQSGNYSGWSIFPGFAYTFWITPAGALITRDARRNNARSVQVAEVRAARAAQKRSLHQQ
eukprot:TRINITY_DN1884_c0_g2_i1.p1 TRINITY_DN1884_c0_g2~~TRINITY_DN1884_c0_g2_i1.p1  ORF type:complete len:249 (-),score=58.40 TRINITY_DN1884_c0_g2_i1:116-862(-)